MSKIPFWIRLTCAAIALLILWLLVCQIALHQYRNLYQFSKEILILENKAKELEKRRQMHQRIQKMVHEDAREYLARCVETISLLKQEKERIAALVKHFPDNMALKERASFLSSDQNQIHFDQSLEGLKSKIEYRLIHPVQMDLDNLRQFLDAVEKGRLDLSQSKPWFIIKKFELGKIYEKGDEKVYSVNVELLQIP